MLLEATGSFLIQALATVNWNLRVVDILTTVLLTVLIGLASWVLHTTLAHSKKFGDLNDHLSERDQHINAALGKISQQLWGVDGKNGHASEVRSLKKSLRGIERYLERMSFRIQRLEERAGLPSGEHHKLDDDPEDD